MKQIFAILFVVVAFVSSYPQSTSDKQDSNKREAERVWELAIAAKGGREKLHSIRNIHISSKLSTVAEKCLKVKKNF